MKDLLILVDKEDRQIGVSGKTAVHEKGLLHRAISVFIFNDKGELLLQQRAKTKYHSPELWTNTCCSHPLPNESNSKAASRRLKEEMKISASLKFFKSFHYRAEFENGLTENEIDHIFYGISNQVPEPNPEEASNWKYIKPQDLLEDVNSNPGNYTAWLKICIERNIFSELIDTISVSIS